MYEKYSKSACPFPDGRLGLLKNLGFALLRFPAKAGKNHDLYSSR